jgi:hypothetical protein
MVKNNDLLARLSKFGFQLFEPDKSQDANRALADMVRSRDLRLWEGFPVVLANSASKALFDYNKVKGYLKTPKDRSNLLKLFAMSAALYKISGAEFPWANALFATLNSGAKKEYDRFFNALKNGNDFEFDGQNMSSARLKTTFNNYFAVSGARLNELLLEKEEMGLEYALSQLFSPKQKDLFLKKLKGEKLTKTEKEYFSRAVKKKVTALANTNLHRLAQKLLE